MDKEAQEIAVGLTEAGKYSLVEIALRVGVEFHPADCRYMNHARLADKGLLQRHATNIGTFYSLTPLGLRVKQYLEENDGRNHKHNGL